jgi:hypothetical protein
MLQKNYIDLNFLHTSALKDFMVCGLWGCDQVRSGVEGIGDTSHILRIICIVYTYNDMHIHYIENECMSDLSFLYVHRFMYSFIHIYNVLTLCQSLITLIETPCISGSPPLSNFPFLIANLQRKSLASSHSLIRY